MREEEIQGEKEKNRERGRKIESENHRERGRKIKRGRDRVGEGDRQETHRDTKRDKERD